MGYSLQSTTSLSSLGDAIRSKTGGSSQMTVEEMITAVNSIVAGGGSSSSSGWIKRKKYKTTSALTITHGTYLDVDTELAQDKEFIFLLTTQDKTASVSQPAKNAILLFYDGSSLVSQYLCASSAFNLTFAVNYDSTNQVNKLRITNNETQYDLDLRSSGYSENGEKVWGNLFYLDESFNEIGEINIPELTNWCGTIEYTQNNNLIDAVFDKLTFNIQQRYGGVWLDNAFGGYTGSNYDWSDKTIVLNGNNNTAYDSLSIKELCKGHDQNLERHCNIRYPFKIVENNNYSYPIKSCMNVFYNSKLVAMRNDFIPSNFTFSDYGGNSRKSAFFSDAHCLRRVPDNFLAEQWANSAAQGTINWNNYQDFLSANMYKNCYVLPKVLGVPVTADTNSRITLNTFSGSFDGCYSLHRLTFYVPTNEAEATMNATGQTIDLTTCGFWASTMYPSLAGIRGFLLESEDKNNAFVINTNGLATGTNVENLNSYALTVAFSTYTRKSAVETINSLPDTSAAITENGGTNTIKFNSSAASAYPAEYKMSELSAAEIAVATAKGWTVTLL